MALKEKLERLRRPHNDEDPTVRIPEWQQAVRYLFDDIELWLQSYVEQGLMQPKRQPVEVEEEDLGRYSTERLDIDLGGGEVLVFIPVARNVVGAVGRVDMFREGRRTEGYWLLRQFDAALQPQTEGDGGSLTIVPTSPKPQWSLWHNAGVARGLALPQLAGPRLELGTPLTPEILERAIDSLLY